MREAVANFPLSTTTWEKSMALPHPLLAIAERQRSTFSLAQARSVGVTLDVLDNRRRIGELKSPHRGVYVIAGSTPSWEQSLMSACLAGGPGAVVSHLAALHLWQLLDLDDPPVEISVPRARSPRFTRGLVLAHRHLDLKPSHMTIRHGLPVTNPLRTVVDAAGDVDERTLHDVLDGGVAQKLFTIRAVDAMRARLAKPGKNGTGRLRAIIEAQAIANENRTVLEARMARLWKRFALPAYSFQHTIRDASGRFVARPDFTIVQPKVIVEVDGWESHGSPSAVDADNRREHKLLALGWLVLRFSWWRIKNEPVAVAAEIHAVLSARLAG
jgi:very-short-patch-repair endonuclease